MDEFIEKLEEIISKNCIIENDNTLSEYSYKGKLILGFGLLKIFDSALKYSNKDTYVFDSHLDESPIEIVSNIQKESDKTVYIDKIFNLTELEYFDMGIIGIFHHRPRTFRENVHLSNFSFGYESRLDILSSIIKANEKTYEYILEEYPRDKLRQSKELQERFNSCLPRAVLTEEKIFFIISEYMSTFNFFIKMYYNYFHFIEVVSKLKDTFFLSDLIKDLSNINIPKENFLNPQNFSAVINNFIKLYNQRYSTTDKDILENLLADSSILNGECYDLRNLLVDLLFTDINLNQYSEINIYDPFYFSRETLDKSKEYVSSKNEKCKVNLYKRIDTPRLFGSPKINHKIVFCTVLESMLLDNDYFYLSDTWESNSFNYLNESCFDFIISDHRSKNIFEEIGFIHQFQDKLDNPSKLVMIIDIAQFYNKSINWMIKNDNLEALFVFNDCFILIANSNKPLKRKNKFILIDYNILVDLYGDNTQIKQKGIRITKKGYSKENILKMLKVYRDFENSEFSKVITNETVVKDFVYDELDKYWGFYYFENDLQELLHYYHVNNYMYLFKIRNKHIKNVPEEVLKMAKKSFYDNYQVIYGIRKLTNMDFYLKDFNYNNLMYDKKRKPYTISKQKKLGGNKSRIIEKTISSIPLYKLITFNPLEFDKEILKKRKIQLFNEIFYLKSDKFLRKFITVFLQTDMGMEEYEFFKNENLCGSKKDFIYIRIPIIPLETQKKIVKAYELNEEHYNLVKQSRDNFRKNILEYDKIEKDMENFNKMEIDVNNGQIVKMSTAKRHLFDGLLWPLSISYLNAVHGTHGDNPNEQLDFHLKLFEFLAAFIDIVLVSAIPKEEYDNLKKELWDGVFFNEVPNKENKKAYKHKYRYLGDFGTWTILYQKLLKCYKKYSISPTFNNDLIESFLDNEIYEIIDLAREIRNKHPAHGPGVSQSLAKQLMEDLKEKIDFVYEIFGYLNGFKLYYCEDEKCKPIDNNFKYNVVSLNGPCDQPIYGEITFNKLLKKDTLYLFNSLNGDLLELNKNLIIFEEAIDMYEEFDKNGEKHINKRPSGRYYLYVFNGFNKRKKKYRVNYKCHQIYTTEKVKDFSFEKWEELLPTK